MGEGRKDFCRIWLPQYLQNDHNLTQLHPNQTNQNTLKELLHVALKDIVIDATLAAELNPSLKVLQQQAKMNLDLFIPKLPPFKVYKIEVATVVISSRCLLTLLALNVCMIKPSCSRNFTCNSLCQLIMKNRLASLSWLEWSIHLAWQIMQSYWATTMHFYKAPWWSLLEISPTKPWTSPSLQRLTLALTKLPLWMS